MPWQRAHRHGRPFWAGLLAFALCVAGLLGQMHRVQHAPGLAEVQAVHDGHDHVGHAHAPGWLEALFGEHSDAQCRLYDQLSTDPALPSVPPVLLPLPLPTAQWLGREGDFVARWAALFDARGPPRAAATRC